jgi:membrane complex biogenesis BtpA family protein
VDDCPESAWPGFQDWFAKKRRLFGVIHLPGLPGSPAWSQSGLSNLSGICERAMVSAKAFAEAGFDALIIENYGDTPFYPSSVPPVTVAAMALIGKAVQGSTNLPLGINVLRNDARSALALALALEAQFIRVNILNGVAATDQGLISGTAHELLREREALGCGPKGARPVAILADVHVKHARTLSEDDLARATADCFERGGADAIIISGHRTGSAPTLAELEAARMAIEGRCPLLIGSGLKPENAGALGRPVNGAIAASAALEDGKAGRPVDPERARALVEAFQNPERRS